MDRRVILRAVVGLHLVVAIVHGGSHALVPVMLGPLLNGLVLITVFLGPVAGVALERRGHPLGIPLFTTTMAGALVLGGVLHFLIENPDHVAELPASPWRWLFRASAIGVFVTPALGVVVGIWYWLGRS